MKRNAKSIFEEGTVCADSYICHLTCIACGAPDAAYGFEPMPTNMLNQYPIREPLHYCAPCYHKALAAWPFKVRT